MGKKPTMKDVARLAGVGLATVDRVLNERGETSVEVTQRVIEVARTLGMRRHLPDPYQRQFQISFFLPPPDTDFRRRLLSTLEIIRKRLDRRIRVAIQFVDPIEPGQIARALTNLQTEAVAFCYWGQGTAELQVAIEGLRRQGVKVFNLLNRPPQVVCDGYFGSDNEAAGRTAAFLAKGRLKAQSEVLILSPMLDDSGPNVRISGFVTALQQHIPRSAVVDVVETRNNPALVRATVNRTLERYPNLGMIYNIGSGAEGLTQPLQKRQGTQPVFVVTHELTQETQLLLKQELVDFVLDQNLSLTIGTAINQMVRTLDGESAHAFVMHHTPFSIYCPENVGDDL